jgi:hypothetical protein
MCVERRDSALTEEVNSVPQGKLSSCFNNTQRRHNSGLHMVLSCIYSGREVCTTHWTDIWVDFKAVLIVGLIVNLIPSIPLCYYDYFYIVFFIFLTIL